ncbi:hypothetical protein CHS0354_036267 [Potamilus streckersoni]|uniref:Uncharacterized protein n=1 Tax=Potamilus streckersoni TaxID=2493646 RepID=A0AAE0W3J5_9BIVA|nr:hypothetical protein CHS0354_036267 [Potamilus streckersoni]
MTYGIVFLFLVVFSRYTSAWNDNYTVGYTLCRSNHKCGNYGYEYKWCYTTNRNNWDYCCANECKTRYFRNGNFYVCSVGNEQMFCGGGGFRNVKGPTCLSSYPCGLHNDVKVEGYFWCYTDKSWDYCCHPDDKCGKHGESYNWCYTGYDKGKNSNGYWAYCTPE